MNTKRNVIMNMNIKKIKYEVDIEYENEYENWYWYEYYLTALPWTGESSSSVPSYITFVRTLKATVLAYALRKMIITILFLITITIIRMVKDQLKMMIEPLKGKDGVLFSMVAACKELLLFYTNCLVLVFHLINWFIIVFFGL